MAVPPPPLKAMLLPETYPELFLVGFPIARLLGPVAYIAAAHIFRLRLLDSRNIWPRHASIAPLIRSMILAIGHDVFGLIGIVLQERNGADGIHTSVERHNHRPPFAIPHKSRTQLVPAAHGAVSWYASIVSTPEVDFVA